MNYHLLTKDFHDTNSENYSIKEVRVRSDNHDTQFFLVLENDIKKAILQLLKTNNVMAIEEKTGIRITSPFHNLSNLSSAINTLKNHNHISTIFIDQIFQNYPIGRRKHFSISFSSSRSKDNYKAVFENILDPNGKYRFDQPSTYIRPNLEAVPSKDEIASVYNLDVLSVNKNDDESVTIEFKLIPKVDWNHIENIHRQLEINTCLVTPNNKNGNSSVQIYPNDVDKFSQNILQLCKTNLSCL